MAAFAFPQSIIWIMYICFVASCVRGLLIFLVAFVNVFSVVLIILHLKTSWENLRFLFLTYLKAFLLSLVTSPADHPMAKCTKTDGVPWSILLGVSEATVIHVRKQTQKYTQACAVTSTDKPTQGVCYCEKQILSLGQGIFSASFNKHPPFEKHH